MSVTEAPNTQRVTLGQDADQHESTADADTSAPTAQAVTDAMTRVAVWAHGAPSESLLKATYAAVALFDLTVATTGTRVYFADRDGADWSVARVKRTVRYLNVKYGRCDSCGHRISLDAFKRQRRGARSDRHYCSNACRQKAYRARKRSG